jgi:ABC-type sugar transport system substrate-binding protein
VEAHPPLVFVSFASSDRELVEKQVIPSLESVEVRTFFAPRDIQLGMSFNEVLVDKLHECHALLAVISKSALLSRWVQAEITLALNLGKPVVTLRCLDVDAARVDLRLEVLQRVDMVDGWELRVKDSLQERTHEKKALVVFIPKATTGYSEQLSQALEKIARTVHPEIRLSISSPTTYENNAVLAGMLEAALELGARAVILTPPVTTSDANPLQKSVMHAICRGIPIVTVDNGFQPEGFWAAGVMPPPNVRCDHEYGGGLAADVLLRGLRERDPVALRTAASWKIAIISGPMSSRTRRQGFVDSFLTASSKNLGRRAVLVSCVETNWEKERAAKAMQDLLRSYKDLDAVFCCNDRLALGALDAVEEGGQRIRPLIVGYDGIPEIRELIRTRRVYASVDQLVAQQARVALRYLESALKEPEEFVRTYHRPEMINPVVLDHAALAEHVT